MRKILIDTMPFVLGIMTVSDALFIGMMFKLYFRNRKNKNSLLLGILCLGLFYDSLILTLGSALPYGGLLKSLSQLRYVLHCALIPLLFPVCVSSLCKNKTVNRIVWILTALLIVVGTVAGFSLVTEPRTVGTLNRYAQSDETAKWVDSLISMLDIVPVFFMIGIGIVIWIRRKNPNMFPAGLFMLLFTLLGIFLGKDPSGDRTKSLMFYISMYGEALMVFFLYRYLKKES